MDDFQTARERFKPHVIRFCLVAEAPPKRDTGRFFYFERVPRGDSLFLEIMKVLYPSEYGCVQDMRGNKYSLLNRFQLDGFYLVDASRGPMSDSRKSTKMRTLKNGLEQLEADLLQLNHPSMKVVLISATVYAVCLERLREIGLNVINTEMIDFPGSGRQSCFRSKFSCLLDDHGWSPE